MADIPKFADGVIRFQKNVFPKHQALFESLSVGQSPEALFITCSDSRIETAMITQTGPGELFVSRNAGNIVPPHSNNTGGVTASIEFAVAALNVPHIVICGHTECGAMRAAMGGEGLEELPHVRDWLSFAEAAVKAARELSDGKSDADQLDCLTEQNVLLQLRHIETHPSVAKRLARGDLRLHGWVYDIKSGDVRAFDESKRKFVPVKDYYSN